MRVLFVLAFLALACLVNGWLFDSGLRKPTAAEISACVTYKGDVLKIAPNKDSQQKLMKDVVSRTVLYTAQHTIICTM